VTERRRRTAPTRPAEAGFSLVGALAGITIMLTLMAMAMPAWRYVMQDDREEELIFRGSAIADAIQRCQRETRALPVSLDFLVQKKFLRKAYTDPMSKHGRWRLIHPGEVIPPPLPTSGPGAQGGKGGGAFPESSGGKSEGGSVGFQPGAFSGGGDPGGKEGGGTFGRPGTFGGSPAQGIATGPILGVASTSRAKSLRLYNGRSHYNEWIFTVGMPRIIGKMPLVVPAPGSPGGGAPAPKPVGAAPKR
jgi:general secretion pathway protein G